MCIFVVKVDLAPHHQEGGSEGVPGPDPTIAKSSAYDRGDIIEIFDDGVEVGKRSNRAEWIAAGHDAAEWDAENKPLTIKVPGPTRADAIEFLNNRIDEDGNTVSKKKLAYFDLDGVWAVISQATKDKINNEREVTLTVAQVKPWLKQKTGVDGEGFPIKDPSDPTVAVNF